MTPQFDLGRRYERSEVLQMLHEIRLVDDGYRLRMLLASWEQELADSLVPVVVVKETYVVSE